MVAAAMALTGCGFADSHAPVPEFMRSKAAEPPPEPAPNVRQLVRDNLNSVFVAASNPRGVRVSSPRHAPAGVGWIACVSAELTSATGRPLGWETYLITIDHDEIVDRRRAESDDACGSERFVPI